MDEYVPYSREYPQHHVILSLTNRGMIYNGGKNEQHVSTKLRKNRDLCKDENGNVRPTLTTLDKKNVVIPPGLREKFLSRLARSVSLNHQMFFNQCAYVENKPRGDIRLIVDLDFEKIDMPAEYDLQFLQLFLDACEILFTEWNSHPFKVFMSKCGPRLCYSKNKGEYMKTGYHIVGHCAIPIHDALQVNMTFRRLLFKFLEEKGIPTEDDMVDTSVYKPKQQYANLRMIFSRKIIDCGVCHNGSSRNTCIECNSTGWWVEKACYLPCASAQKGRLDTKAESDAVHGTNWETIVRNHQIWPLGFETRDDFCVPPSEETLEERKEFVEKVAAITKKGDQCGAKLHNGKLVSHTDISKESKDILQEFLQTYSYNGRNLWDGITIFCNKNYKTVMLITPRGANFKRCPYKGDEHKSNSVYFTLHKSGVIKVGCHDAVCKEHMEEKTIEIPFENPMVLQEIFGGMSAKLKKRTKRIVPHTDIKKGHIKRKNRPALTAKDRAELKRQRLREQKKNHRLHQLDQMINLGTI